jgi:rhodanese-related sulfurtransferase
MIEQWTPEEVAERLARGEKLNLVDVRERDEWQDGHIAEARLIPMSELTNRLDELNADDEPMVILCRSGNRSTRVCDYLDQQGYSVINMTGGMLNWSGDVVAGE